MVELVQQAELTALNSFSVVAHCKALTTLEHRHDFNSLIELQPYRHGPVMMLGGGSNVLFTADYPGLIVLNRIRGRQILDATDKHAYVRLFAGENWHQAVMWSLAQDLYGLENLALIPGLAGAAPIQNIGAYGVELADLIDHVEVWDRSSNQARMLNTKACKFSYRDSIFKQQPERYFVIQITLRLARKARLKLNYPGIKAELDRLAVNKPTAKDVCQAVINLRTAKLPEPDVAGNAGSFFKNPLISNQLTESLKSNWPDLPVFPDQSGMHKLSAAWLIEQCGWKGYSQGDAAVSARHALVLVNRGQASGKEIMDLARTIQQSVHDRFGLMLTPEPEIVGPSELNH